MIKLVHPIGIGFDFSDHVRDVCRPGDGTRTCRYLVGDILGGDGGLHCARLDPELAARIDRRVADGTFVAQAINCPGRPPEEKL